MEILAHTSEETRTAPFPSRMTKTALCSFLLPIQNQSKRFDFVRKAEETDMKLSLKAEAKWSEFRLTPARGLAQARLRVFLSRRSCLKND